LRTAFGEAGGSRSGLEPGDRLAVLNLATCKQLVEMMDGELRVEQGGVDAGPDAGTLFEFTIRWEALPSPVTTAPVTLEGMRALRAPDQMPIVLIAAAPPGAEEAGAADSGVVQATLTKPVAPRKLHDVMAQVGAHPVAAPAPVEQVAPGALTVLVADDNALNQNLLRRLVAKLGHKVDVVSNGREAVAAVAQSPYDAVLMDVLMPEMDGLEAAEAICRRWPRGTRPRLIALTAMAGPGDQERCLRAGFDDYMIKPVHLEQLSEAFKVAAGWRTNPAATP